MFLMRSLVNSGIGYSRKQCYTPNSNNAASVHFL